MGLEAALPGIEARRELKEKNIREFDDEGGMNKLLHETAMLAYGSEKIANDLVTQRRILSMEDAKKR